MFTIILLCLISSISADTHFETIFKPTPKGTTDFDDALSLVDTLRSKDNRARQIAENGLAFARTYLTKEVMLVFLREVLQAYKDLFYDMEEYMLSTVQNSDSKLFVKHMQAWQQDWRTVHL